MSDATSLPEDASPRRCAEKARAIWLECNPDMKNVERLYRVAVHSFLPLQILNSTDSEDHDIISSSKKRRRIEDDGSEATKMQDWQRIAVEQLCMILCQSGRAEEAKLYLQELGYTCRLASCVLDYPLSSKPNGAKDNKQNPKLSKNFVPCCIWDNFLSKAEVQHLQRVFQDPKADYWLSHNYEVEPPSPYFSYIIPLERHDNGSSIKVDSRFGALGDIIMKIYDRLLSEQTSFPKLSGATAVEIWAHNRPHPTGHQFHFDSDNEGQGKLIKNPILSTILYLSNSSQEDMNGIGGPSVITNQSIHSRHLATKAWASLSQNNTGRIVAFDGTMLHGVIPGKGGHSGNRRVTLMLAFWRRIRVRKGDDPGAARPFPFVVNDTLSGNTHIDKESWSELLTLPLVAEEEGTQPIAREPIPLDSVYETLDGVKWTKAMGFPDYDNVYQGF